MVSIWISLLDLNDNDLINTEYEDIETNDDPSEQENEQQNDITAGEEKSDVNKEEDQDAKKPDECNAKFSFTNIRCIICGVALGTAQ